ncbi:hypothetical protein [Nocardiopsis suaedae]|uniref:Uncharacterized protein n=1 Tax=Nocardiopsis suaedae TaxID=3018444 RepID=A0ABT4TPX7_9ACTN|nr:hypothetical protein [Nocardiopsis suaedae]MDA2806744.1 hypothetical protein [Nocardiopsis suaedae]
MKPDSWLRAHPGTPPARVPPLTVRLDPAHGPQLLELPMEPVWATTWEHDANTWIGPHLGLPELPVVPWSSPRTPDPSGLHWKTRELSAWAGERPFAWIDDEPGQSDREWLDQHHPAHVLLLRIDASRGLAGEDFALLREWAEQTRAA